MNEGRALAGAAASFIGVRFRLHGRDPESGLDCVGLVSASLAAIGRQPLSMSGYGLRNCNVRNWFGAAKHSGLRLVSGKIEAGDVLVVSPGPLQHHLLVAEDEPWAIHAHASLQRVVREPIIPSSLITTHWRP